MEYIKPDAVIVATGAMPMIPDDILGVESEKVVDAFDVLTERVHAGRRVAIVGGGLVGCDTALGMHPAHAISKRLFQKGRK